VAVLAVIVIYTTLGVLTYQGATSPWSPKMTAWSGDPVPERLVRDSTPLRLAGAAVFQNKTCRNCHALDGLGGERGPDLTAVGTRLTRGQLIDQVSNGTPGGGNMPAYGKQISPAEMTALVNFLENLRPPGVPPARQAATRNDEKEYP
jgi:ubiquinol-cytochrome c reductase cytochrome b subunit